MHKLTTVLLTPLESVTADLLLGVMGLFVVLVCVHQAIEMDKGDRFCRMFKYVFTCIAGAFAIALAIAGLTTLTLLISTAALALFLWPTVIYFYRGEYRNRVNDK